MRMIRLLCVDDNDEVADALRTRLGLESDICWLGRLARADGLSAATQQLAPDVVLLDIDMPGKSPFRALQELALLERDTRVIMLSALVDVELIDRAVEAGAWGYLSKAAATATIAETVRRVAAGEFVLGLEASDAYARHYARHGEDEDERLDEKLDEEQQ
jgi:DNA-binding NarL/FixJ family response regulator